MKQYKEKVIQYWNSLQAREQKMLIIGGAILGILILYLNIDSLFSRNTLLEQQIVKEQQLLEWMQPVVQQIIIVRTQDNHDPITPADLLAQVELSLAQVGLSGQMTGLNLITHNEVRLVFDTVVYVALVDWLYGLSHQGVIIKEWTVTKTDEPGVVQANILLSAVEAV